MWLPRALLFSVAQEALSFDYKTTKVCVHHFRGVEASIYSRVFPTLLVICKANKIVKKCTRMIIWESFYIEGFGNVR